MIEYKGKLVKVKSKEGLIVELTVDNITEIPFKVDKNEWSEFEVLFTNGYKKRYTSISKIDFI